MFEFQFEGIDPVSLPENTKEWLVALIKSEEKKPGNISFILGDDEYILKINREFLQHDYYTDIITFDYVKGKTISGDIFISLPRVRENSEKQNTTFENELQRVLAHGLLHLCGYKDKTEAEAAQMRLKEDFYLARNL